MNEEPPEGGCVLDVVVEFGVCCCEASENSSLEYMEFGFVSWSVADVFLPCVSEVWGVMFICDVDESKAVGPVVDGSGR